MTAKMYADGQGTLRNMYDCPACPKCGDTYRYPMRDGLIYCDECSHREPWDDFMRRSITGGDAADGKDGER